jgi:phosphatidylglycerophosphatase A
LDELKFPLIPSTTWNEKNYRFVNVRVFRGYSKKKVKFLEKSKILPCFIASTGFTGYFPIAPGTVGSFVAIVALWFLPPISWITLSILSVVFYIIGGFIATEAEKVWGHDPGKITWDEVVGQMVTVILLPKTLPIYIAAFFAFRFFDIVKPPPARQAEDFPKGWGVMTDDIFAGIYANLLLQIIFRIIL